jgi:hypothetical protein
MAFNNFFKKSVEWTEETAATRGLPRPYKKVSRHFRKAPDFLEYPKDILYVPPKVPVPYQTIPVFVDKEFLQLSKEREREVVENHLCPYCGVAINDEEESIKWTTLTDDQNLIDLEIRVPSDNIPFHKECMEQTRVFCPFMRLTEDSEYVSGKYKDIV